MSCPWSKQTSSSWVHPPRNASASATGFRVWDLGFGTMRRGGRRGRAETRRRPRQEAQGGRLAGGQGSQCRAACRARGQLHRPLGALPHVGYLLTGLGGAARSRRPARIVGTRHQRRRGRVCALQRHWSLWAATKRAPAAPPGLLSRRAPPSAAVCGCGWAPWAPKPQCCGAGRFQERSAHVCSEPPRPARLLPCVWEGLECEKWKRKGVSGCRGWRKKARHLGSRADLDKLPNLLMPRRSFMLRLPAC